jgi:Spy/CpxP family protein refolding chaperone
MKRTLFVAAVGALLGSIGAYAQMPPPPPQAPGAQVDGSRIEQRREMRRVIIRDAQDGPRSLNLSRGGAGIDLLGAYGLDPRMILRMADALDLTPQQRGKVVELVETVRPEMTKITREIRAESRRLRELDAGDAKYASESTAIARKMGELTTNLIQQGAGLRGKVWQVLTPEQRKKADMMRDRMRERMKDRIEIHRGKPRALVFDEAEDIG